MSQILPYTIWDCYKGGADPADDKLVGATSYVATTPSLLIRKTDKTKILRPFKIDFAQFGVVAGGLIRAIIKLDKADRFSSGGTEWVVKNRAQDADPDLVPGFTVLEGATATAEGEDEDAPTKILDTTIFQTVTSLGTGFYVPFEEMDRIGPVGSMLIYLFAASTAPTFVGTLSMKESEE